MKHLLSLSLVFLLFACDVSSNKPINYFQHAKSGSLATVFSDDAAIGIVSSHSEGIIVWDLQYNQKIYQWNHQGQDNNANVIGLVNISADKSHAVTADREAFAIWDLNTGEPTGFWRIDESSVRDIAVSNQGKGILVGRSNGKVLYFEHEIGRRLEFLGHQDRINSVDLSPNGLYALTGGNDYKAFLWNTQTGQIVYEFTHPSRVTKVALESHGRFAFTADSQKHARIWDLQTGQEVSRLKYLQRQKIFSTARFSQDGKHLLTGSPDRHLTLWDVQSGAKIQDWKVRPNESSLTKSAVVYAAAFMGEHQVISGSSAGWAEVWTVEEK